MAGSKTQLLLIEESGQGFFPQSVFRGLVHWLLFGLFPFFFLISQLWNNLASEVTFIPSLRIFHILTPTELIVLDPQVTGSLL